MPYETEAYTVKPQAGSLGANPDLSKSASDVSGAEALQVPERLTRPSVPALDTILGVDREKVLAAAS